MVKAEANLQWYETTESSEEVETTIMDHPPLEVSGKDK